MEDEESNGVPGSVPEFGAIFLTCSTTKRECFRRKIFGLPSWLAHFVKQVKEGMVLFLFEYERRELHGVFKASSDGAVNIVPHAFSSTGKKFPAQVEFTTMWHCRPLAENEFCDAIRENYFTPKKFKLGLSEDQVRRLFSLFKARELKDGSPQRQLTRSKVARPGGCSVSMRKVRLNGYRNETLISNQVTGEHDEDNSLGPVSSTMHSGDICQDERVFNDDRVGTYWNRGHKYKVDNKFAPAFSNEYFGASSGIIRGDTDSSMVAKGEWAGNRWNADTAISNECFGASPSLFSGDIDTSSVATGDWAGHGRNVETAISNEYIGASSSMIRDIDATRAATSDWVGNGWNMDIEHRPLQPTRQSLVNCRKVTDDLRFARSDRFEKEHKDDSFFVRAIPREYSCLSGNSCGIGGDIGRLVTSRRLGNETSLGVDPRQGMPVACSSDSFGELSEDVRFKRKGMFENKCYEDSGCGQISREYPSLSQLKLNSSTYSNSHIPEADSFARDPARPHSTFIQSIEPQRSNTFQQTIYRDAIVTSTLPCEQDVSSTNHICSSSPGIYRHSTLLQERATDSRYAVNAHPCFGNQSIPLSSVSRKTSLCPDISSGASNIISLSCSNQYEISNSTSIPGPAFYENTAIASTYNEDYADLSSLKTSLVPSPGSRNRSMAEHLSSSSFGHSIYPSLVSENDYPVPLEEKVKFQVHEYDNESGFASDFSLLKQDQLWGRHSLEPKSIDHLDNVTMNSSVHQMSKGEQLGYQKKRDSVFSRLALPPKGCHKGRNIPLGGDDDEIDPSVNEVMAMLHHSHSQWKTRELKSIQHFGSNASFGIKKQLTVSSNLSEEHSATISKKFKVKGISPGEEKSYKKSEGIPFVDFKRRSIARKSLDDTNNHTETTLKKNKLEGVSPSEEISDQKSEGTPFLDFKRRSLIRKSLHDTKDRSATISKKIEIKGTSPGEENGDQKAEGTPVVDFKRRHIVRKSLDDTTERSATISKNIETEGISPVEGNNKQKAEETPFMDFKRRSVVRKNLDDTEPGNCGESADNKVTLLGQRKRRKLIRPDFSMNASTENRGTEGGASKSIQVPSLECSESKNKDDDKDFKVSVSHLNENLKSQNDNLLHVMHQSGHKGKNCNAKKSSNLEEVSVDSCGDLFRRNADRKDSSENNGALGAFLISCGDMSAMAEEGYSTKGLKVDGLCQDRNSASNYILQDMSSKISEENHVDDPVKQSYSRSERPLEGPKHVCTNAGHQEIEQQQFFGCKEMFCTESVLETVSCSNKPE